MTDEVLVAEMKVKNNLPIRDQIGNISDGPFYRLSEEIRGTNLLARLMACSTVDQLTENEKTKLKSITKTYDVVLNDDADITAFKIEFSIRLYHHSPAHGNVPE